MLINELITIRTEQIAVYKNLTSTNINSNIDTKDLNSLPFKIKNYKKWIETINQHIINNTIIINKGDIVNLKLTEKLESYLIEILETGKIKDIDNAVNEYKYGNAQILLSNSTLFGCGMNFENSSHILFVHKMDCEIEQQVIGRAQRMGRKSVLEIIYLQYENELEHKRKSKSNYSNNYELNKSDELEGYYNEQQYYNLIENIQHFNFDEMNPLKSNISSNEILNLEFETQCTEINNFIDLPQIHGEYIDVNLEELISNLH
jgi:hypothetical protein